MIYHLFYLNRRMMRDCRNLEPNSLILQDEICDSENHKSYALLKYL